MQFTKGSELETTDNIVTPVKANTMDAQIDIDDLESGNAGVPYNGPLLPQTMAMNQQ
jgi:hypothetical protein